MSMYARLLIVSFFVVLAIPFLPSFRASYVYVCVNIKPVCTGAHSRKGAYVMERGDSAQRSLARTR